MFKICIIGSGWVANFGHGPAYKKYADSDPDVQLTACCDADVEKSVQFKEKFGFSRHYADFRQMLQKEQPDAVCLNVPDSLIASLSAEILETGVPLILEKPPGLNPKETRELIAIAEKIGTPNMVAFNRRFMPIIQRTKKTIENTEGLNKIQHIEYYLSRFNRTEDNFDITAIHGIDTVRYLTNSDYSSVQFTYRELPEVGKNVMNIHVFGEMKSGATATLNFYPVSGAVVERMVINTAEYTFFVNIPVWDSIDSPGKIISVEKNEIINELSLNDKRQNVDTFEQFGFYGEDLAFFDAVRSGKKLSPDIHQSLQTIELMECIQKKVRTYNAQPT
jgi:predicted dehydrogenase